MAEKTALFAPIARASVRITVMENVGDLRMKRKADLRLATVASRNADAVDVAHFFLEFFLTAEFEDGAAASFFGSHARGDVLVGELVNVEAEFGIHLSVGSALRKDGFPPGHG